VTIAAASASLQNSTNVRSPREIGARTSLHRAAVGVLARTAPRLAATWAIRRFCTPPAHSREPEALAATARWLAVPVGGRPVYAWDWGHGPTVLLVHGWGGRGAQLAALAPALLAAGFRVAAFDAPAHGASPGRRATLLDFRDAVRAVAARVGPLAGVVAHSLGAAATALAMKDGLRVPRAVFLGPPAEAVWYLRRFLAVAGIPPTLAPAVERRFEQQGGFRWADLAVPAAARGFDTPLLVVHDRGDREVPWADGAAIAAAWPGAELWSTEGLGHRKILRDPAVIARTVAFLDPAGGDHARCATAGCPRAAVEPDEDGALRCGPCAIERELYDREARWARAFPD
jgi:pimeloyl-ACP methyl ester carboxylesterase